MDNIIIGELQSQLQFLSGYDYNQPIPFNAVLAVREAITSLAQQISDTAPPISSHLIDLKNALFMEPTPQLYFINQIVYGQIIEATSVIRGQIIDANQPNQPGCENICHLLHPDIQRVSSKLYRDGSYAEAACNAFIEIDSRLQRIYREKRPNTEKELSGQPLMNKIFADNDPLFEVGDLTTQSGKDIQSGTRFMFAGAMAALRNPKSHQNIRLEKDDCMRRLIFASMLMYKIDGLVADSSTTE